MRRRLLVKIIVCIVSFGGFLYSFLEAQNDITRLRMRLPKIAKEVLAIKEDNMRLQYQIDCFENPNNLIKLAKSSQFSHLKHPSIENILVVPQGLALKSTKEGSKALLTHPHLGLMVGAKQ